MAQQLQRVINSKNLPQPPTLQHEEQSSRADVFTKKSIKIRGIESAQVSPGKCLRIPIKFPRQLNNPHIIYSIIQEDPRADKIQFKHCLTNLTNNGFEIFLDNFHTENLPLKVYIHYKIHADE